MSSSTKLKTLLQWCTVNSIFIDHRIRLQDAFEGQADIGVFSLESYIPPDTTLVKIPEEAILSVRTCSLANHIPRVSYGLGAQLSLSLALYVEILKHCRSRWYGYLQSLPDHLVDLPLFWERVTEKKDCSDAYDRAEALLWLRGTEAGKILSSNTNDSSILVEITNFFNDVAGPLLRSHSHVWMEGNSSLQPTLEGFYHAFSLVSSRAFLVDTYHGLSMVPIADAFNHTVEHHVHLESDYLVCPECGSLKECVHDRDELRTSRPSFPQDHKHDTYYEMVSNSGIAPNSEVFNTFGETLTNAQLLNQYGFVLDVNENDRLLWSAQEVLDVCVQGEGTEDLEVLTDDVLGSLLGLSHFFDQSQLVCRELDGGRSLFLDDEGRISAGLWALLTVSALRSSPQVTDIGIHSEKHLTEIVDAQLRMEAFSEEEDDTEANLPASPSSDIVVQVARSMVNLCDRRKRRSGKPDSIECDLSDLLEQIPQSHRRIRLAITVLLTERSILDACQEGWSTLIDCHDRMA